MKSFNQFLKGERGIAGIEMAFIAPIMLLIYFGLVDITSLISLNRRITAVAGATADLVAQERTSILKAKIADYYNVSAMIVSPTPATEVRVEIFAFRNVAGTITKMWSTNNGFGPSCGAQPSTATMLPLMVAGNDVIVTRSCMNFTPYITNWLGTSVLGATSFAITQSISVRPRSSLQLTCYQTTVAAGTLCT